MNSKIFIGLFLILSLTTFVQADLSTNVNNYRVTSQTGTDSVYEILMNEIEIDIDDSWWLWEWFTDLFGEDDSINGTEICIEAEFEEEDCPTTIPVYVNELPNVTYYDMELEIEDDKYKVKFCYEANPYEERHLKFGNNSIIIEIVSAEHLDSSYDFIADIFDEVSQLDDVWSENISSGEYVGVAFEEELNNSRDIKIYPRIMAGTPTIEVYEKDNNTLLATFDPIIEDEYQRIYLTNLTGTQDTFDLKIVGGVIQFDHIIDPPQPPGWTGGLGDSPDPVTIGNNITYTATANDNSGDADLDWNLIVCSTNSITDQPSPVSCDATEICRSSNMNSWDVQANCQYNTSSESAGDLTVWGFLCGGDDRCTNGETNFATTTVEAVPIVYGDLEVSISKPDNNSNWNEGNTNLTINATVTCVGEASADCGIVSAYARYNKSSGIPDTLINVTEGGLPFYNINGSSYETYQDITAYYKLDESSGPIIDELGVYNGTNNGSTPNVAGKINTAYDFEADENDSISISPMNLNNSRSISAWIKYESVPASYSSIVDIGNDTLRDILFFYAGTDNDNLRVIIDGTASYPSETIPDLQAGTWYFVAVSAFNNGTVLYYLDGVEIGNGTATYNSTMIPPIARIGGHTDTKLYFDGIIDEVGIWDRSLSQEEIINLNNSGNGLPLYERFITSKMLSKDDSWNVSWILNVTSSDIESYLVDVNFTSSYGNSNVPDNNTADRLVNLNPSVAPVDNPPTVTLSTPANATSSSNTSYDFTCNVTDDHQIDNTTLYVWHDNDTIFNTTLNTSTGTSLNYTFNVSDFIIDTYYWNCLSWDNNSQSAWATKNFTLTVTAADTCTCAGLNNNWEVDMSDYCILTEDCYLGTGKISFINAGNFSCDAELNTTDFGDPGAGAIFWVQDECSVWVS